MTHEPGIDERINEAQWEDTLNEGCILIADIGGGYWAGCVAQWMDGAEGPSFFAFIGVVEASDWDEAERLLNECTDPDIYMEIGWAETNELAEAAVRRICV